MNRSLPLPHLKFPALAAAALAFAVSAQAQTGFVVGSQTGLELDPNTPAKTVEKKIKPAAAPDEKKATEITCSGETVFDVKAGKATFIKEVKIVDPQFNLTSEKLTVFLKKSAKTEPKPEGNPDASAAPSPSPSPEASATPKPEKSDKNDKDPIAGGGASGLERAIAEGNVVISQDKVDEKTGEITRYIGKGAKADYNALSGEMTLSGWPQIQQGLNTQVATEEGTVMIMNKDGHLRTVGRSKTVIQSDSKSDGKSAKP